MAMKTAPASGTSGRDTSATSAPSPRSASAAARTAARISGSVSRLVSSRMTPSGARVRRGAARGSSAPAGRVRRARSRGSGPAISAARGRVVLHGTRERPRRVHGPAQRDAPVRGRAPTSGGARPRRTTRPGRIEPPVSSPSESRPAPRPPPPRSRPTSRPGRGRCSRGCAAGRREVDGAAEGELGQVELAEEMPPAAGSRATTGASRPGRCQRGCASRRWCARRASRTGPSPRKARRGAGRAAAPRRAPPRRGGRRPRLVPAHRDVCAQAPRAGRCARGRRRPADRRDLPGAHQRGQLDRRGRRGRRRPGSGSCGRSGRARSATTRPPRPGPPPAGSGIAERRGLDGVERQRPGRSHGVEERVEAMRHLVEIAGLHGQSEGTGRALTWLVDRSPWGQPAVTGDARGGGHPPGAQGVSKAARAAGRYGRAPRAWTGRCRGAS